VVLSTLQDPPLQDVHPPDLLPEDFVEQPPLLQEPQPIYYQYIKIYEASNDKKSNIRQMQKHRFLNCVFYVLKP
jgi:hypothetical protein